MEPSNQSAIALLSNSIQLQEARRKEKMKVTGGR